MLRFLIPVMWMVAIVPLSPMVVPMRSAGGQTAIDVVLAIDAAGYESVSAPSLMVPHLTRRPTVHSFPLPFACGGAVAGYRSPALLPEAVVVSDSQLGEWGPILDEFGYQETAAYGVFRIWATGLARNAPLLDCT